LIKTEGYTPEKRDGEKTKKKKKNDWKKPTYWGGVKLGKLLIANENYPQIGNWRTKERDWTRCKGKNERKIGKKASSF